MAKGGRPGDSGGLTIDYGNGMKANYIANNGRIFNADTLEEVEIGRRVTLSEFAKASKRAGYGVETRTAAQERARVEARNNANRNKPDYSLGYGLGPGGSVSASARRRARQNSLQTRTAKRSKRR